MAEHKVLRLYCDCPACDGAGRLTNPAYDEWEAIELTRRRIDPVRYGTGEDLDWRESGMWPDVPCDRCCGRGVIPYVEPSNGETREL